MLALECDLFIFLLLYIKTVFRFVVQLNELLFVYQIFYSFTMVVIHSLSIRILHENKFNHIL